MILAFFTYGRSGDAGLALQGRQGEPTPAVTLESLDQQDDRFNDESSLAPQTVTLEIAPRTQQVKSPLDMPGF